MTSPADLRALADKYISEPTWVVFADMHIALRSAADQLSTDAETIRVQKERIERLEGLVRDADRQLMYYSSTEALDWHKRAAEVMKHG